MMTTVKMPQLGESVVEGTIGKWLVKEGDAVTTGQPVVEILTDKADSEVSATASGVVTKIHAAEGATVSVGASLVDIDPAAQKSAGPSAPSNSTAAAQPVARAASNIPASAPAESTTPSQPTGAIKGSPAVRKAAREQGIDLNEVSGRVGLRDLNGQRPSNAQAQPAPQKSQAFQVPPYVPRPGDEFIPFTRRRRIIAEHMVYSKLTSPHVVTVAECDLYKTSKLRDQYKDQLKKEGISLTFLAFVSAAIAKALHEHRELNARVLDDGYVLLRDINLGVAVDAPDGLVVPVIRNADTLTVRGMAKAIDDVASRARDGHLTPNDLAGKTFTVSNPGRKGNLYGGAIISQPNVGILRIGEIQKRVVVIEHEEEDLMAIHPVMYMALSYDHRIVDGVAANAFLYRVTELLETGDFQI